MLWSALLPVAFAARITVDASGGGDFADLPDAVAAAGPGDYLAVAPGTYSAVTLTTEHVPMVGLQGASSTWIDAAGDAWAVDGAASSGPHLEGFTLTGATSGGLRSYVGVTVLRDVQVLDVPTGLYLSMVASLDAEALLVAHTTDGVLSAPSSGAVLIRLDGATLIDNQTHVSGSFNLNLRHLITYGGALSACAITIDYGLLYDYGTLPTCIATTGVALDLDPGFVAYTDDGDPFNDDLSLTSASPAIDQGDPACLDADGSVCELGYTGGPLAGRIDSDADGLPDRYEAETGHDPALDDGAIDEDADGLDNLGEYLFGTDPFTADTDADGEEDQDELTNRRDPTAPRDNAPTASIAATTGQVGATLPLDGSASSDPTGDPLTYSWVLTAAPAGSALGGPLGTSPVVAIIPDVRGLYTVTLVVHDGHQSSAATVTLLALDSAGLRIPEDFPTFADAQAILRDGMTVSFGAGTFEIDTAIAHNLSLRGAGRARTTLTGSGGAVLAADQRQLSLTELRVAATGSQQGLSAQNGALIQLNDVEITAEDAVAVAVDRGALVARGARLESLRSAALDLNAANAALADARISSAEAAAIEQNLGRLTLDGALLDAASVALSSTLGEARLDHVSLGRANTAIQLNGSGHLAGQNLVFFDTPTATRCVGSTGMALDHALFSNVNTLTLGCAEPTRATVESSIGASGLPNPGSAAWDGGDSWRPDPDGTPSDMGLTGGAFGLGLEHGLDDPAADADGDRLSALSEQVIGTRDDDADSDGDGVDDWSELLNRADPADRDDHLPAVDDAPTLRLNPGEAATLAVPFGADPDGDACAFAWDDGAPTDRAADTSAPGVQRLPWTLSCGDGATNGVYTLIVHERVPVEPATFASALSAAEDHTLLLLAPGDYVGPISVSDRPIAIWGAGRDTRILGDVALEHPQSLLRDVHVEGEVRARGEVVAVEVWGALSVADAAVRSTRVHGGPLDASHDSALRFATVWGALRAHGGSALCAASTIAPAVSNAEATEARTALADDFIFANEDPALALLEPWPGSALWESCASEPPDDVGATGGDEAWQTDADADGQNDTWEAHYAVDVPTEDPDADGLDNLGEFTAGTDPTNPDTDGDRLPDGEDPEPRGADETAVITAILTVDDFFPPVGAAVTASAAGSSDASGGALATTWLVYGPDGRLEHLSAGSPTATFTVDSTGPWSIHLELRAEDGVRVTRQALIYGRRDVRVPEGADLQDYIDRAEPGDALILEDARSNGAVTVDKPLVLRHAEGSTRGRLDGDSGVPALRVSGARVRVEDLAVRADDEGTGVEVIGGVLELRRAQIVGGTLGLNLYNSTVEMRNATLIGSQRLIYGSNADLRVTHSALGWALEDNLPIQLVATSTLRADNSIFVFSGRVEPGLFINSTAVARDCLFSGRVFSRVFGVATPGALEGDPAFLLDPGDSDYWLAADLRLAPSSPAVDVGPAGALDLDGSPLDLGVFGGALGDWPDIDNDRDGYSNLDGDCDDLDATIVPDRVRGVCPAGPACGGCASAPSGGLAGALALLALTRRHDRRRARG